MSAEKEYLKLLNLLKDGNIATITASLENHSLEKLQKFIDYSYEDEISEDLFIMLLQSRKQKMDKHFVYNKGNISAILQMEQKLKGQCIELKKETKNELKRITEHIKLDNKYMYEISGSINLNCGEPLLEHAFSFHNYILSFQFAANIDIEIKKIDDLPIFDFETNFADKISHKKLMNLHISFPFFTFFDKSYLSLQDISEIVAFSNEITIKKYSHWI